MYVTIEAHQIKCFSFYMKKLRCVEKKLRTFNIYNIYKFCTILDACWFHES